MPWYRSAIQTSNATSALSMTHQPADGSRETTKNRIRLRLFVRTSTKLNSPAVSTPELCVDTCLAKHKAVLPSIKSYRLDFFYDGHGYRPTLSSAAAVRIFESR